VAQDFHGVDLTWMLDQVADSTGYLGKLLHQFFVELQGDLAIVLLVAQGHFHLAPGQRLAAFLAHAVFQGAQGIGQTRAHLGVAMIHGFDLPDQAVAFQMTVGAGESGHTADHVNLETAVGKAP